MCLGLLGWTSSRASQFSGLTCLLLFPLPALGT